MMKIAKYLCLSFALLLTVTTVYGQHNETLSRSRTKGDILFEQGRFVKALEMYEKHEDKKGVVLDDSYYEKKATTYFKLAKFDEAVKCYAKCIENESLPVDTTFFLGLLNRSSLLEEYPAFAALIGDNDDNNKNRSYQLFSVEPLHIINSKFNEFSPVENKDLFYYSTNHNKKGNRQDKNSELSYYDIFTTELDLVKKSPSFDGRNYEELTSEEREEVEEAKKSLSHTSLSKLNTVYNDGPLAIVGDEIYATRNEKHKKGGNDVVFNLNIYKAHILEDGKLTKAEETFFGKYFSPNSVGHITFSPDGMQACFVAKDHEGVGKSDLWFSERYSGEWSEPLNAGAMINTPGDEVFPFWSNDDYIYFSSDGYPGSGGLDIYRVKAGDVSGLPMNIGDKINSEYDDFSFSLGEDGTGYFASNRTGGQGEDDIYVVKAKRGEIVVELISDPADAINPWFVLSDSDGKKLEPFDIADKISVSHPNLLYGDYKLEHILDNDSIYGEVELYQDKATIYVKFPKRRLPADTLGVRFSNFIFDKDSETEIDQEKFKRLTDFLHANPDVIILVKGHTDQFGTVKYNDALGMRRCNAMEKFLREANVINTIKKVSKGRSELVSSVNHRLNRRVDIELYDNKTDSLITFVESGTRGQDRDLTIYYDKSKAFDIPVESGYYIKIKTSNRYTNPIVIAARFQLPSGVKAMIHSDSSFEFKYYIRLPFETKIEADNFAKDILNNKKYSIEYINND